MDFVDGAFDRLVYYKDGFAIFKLNHGGTHITVKGKVDKFQLKRGRKLKFSGKWTHHPEYGPSFQIESSPEQQQQGDGNLRFLCSIPHISEARAKHLLAQHGSKLFTRLYTAPEETLSSLTGLNGDRKAEITDWLTAHKQHLGLELLLHRLGFGETMRERIKETFKPHMVKDLRENPYLLLQVKGVGFTGLDKKILLNKVLPPDSPARVSACIQHSIELAGMAEGHTILTERAILDQCRRLGLTDAKQIRSGLATLIEEGSVQQLDGLYGSQESLEQEHLIAKSLVGIAGSKPTLPKSIKVDDLDEDQAEAVRMMLTEPVSFLTGGPGSGKTFSINILLKNLEASGEGKFTLCAPTGKAARRMTESTGHPASTIHRLLMNGHVEGTVVVDECSMLSTELASELTEFLWRKGVKRLVLVGDPDQLPSIGPGRVFDDLIDSEVFPVSRLTKVRRQAQGSNIVVNAARIRNGEGLLYDNKSDFKTSFVSLDKQEDFLLKAFSERIPTLKKKNGTDLDPLRDVQVIVPQHKGQLGCSRLNTLLQDSLNPNKGGLSWDAKYGDFPFSYRVGDKVIVTKNSKEYGLVNGDIGYIERLDAEEMHLKLDRDDEDHSVFLPREFLTNMRPGYAITVHRAQGSEAPMVVVVYNEQTPKMFQQRNMLYTAVTRARENLWLIGNQDVVEASIANNAPSLRQTGLVSQVQASFEQLPLYHPLRERATTVDMV